MSIACKVKGSRITVLASFGLLAVVLVLGNWWAALPLLLFVWGLWKQDWRSHIWLCFVLLFYFMVSINQLAGLPSLLGYIELSLICILFTSAMLWCRWVKKIPVTVLKKPQVKNKRKDLT